MSVNFAAIKVVVVIAVPEAAFYVPWRQTLP
jgi:hypothetical protein